MILVVGGMASGKRTYVRSLGYANDQFSLQLAAHAPVLYGLEQILRNGPLTAEDLKRLMCKDVVVCCEVGLGVVPMDANERAWRELVGRTCCELAAHANSVVRLVCGIPVVLKTSTTQEECT